MSCTDSAQATLSVKCPCEATKIEIIDYGYRVTFSEINNPKHDYRRNFSLMTSHQYSLKDTIK